MTGTDAEKTPSSVRVPAVPAIGDLDIVCLCHHLAFIKKVQLRRCQH